MTKKFIPVFILIIIIVGVGCFFAGSKFGKSNKALGPGGEGFPTNGQAMGSGTIGGSNRSGGNSISGSILSKDDESITVETQSGSKIVLFSNSTDISKSVDGTSVDLEVGKTVMVSGTSNSDGSLTATSIELRTIPVVMPSATPIK